MSINSYSIEEYPLQNNGKCQKRPMKLKGPSRVIRLCLLGICLPTFLISLPLYMRYYVYGSQMYPLAMSDMRLLDNKISTTWCQKQKVQVNATFNAFLLAETPTLSTNMKPMSMVRHLILEDDTKEYWGFYLLKGSSVTVSTCVRWPGASLIVIRGHKHLHECAYIGDNSSEELDELVEAIREGTFVAPTATITKPNKTITNTTKTERVNEPNLMKRHQQDVQFHHPLHNNSTNNYTIKHFIDTSPDITDPKLLTSILQALQEKSQRNNRKKKKNNKNKKSDEADDYKMHVNRNLTIADGESRNFQIETPQSQTKSQETLDLIVKKLENLGERRHDILKEINRRIFENSSFNHSSYIEESVINMKGRHYSKPIVNFDDNIDKNRRRRRRDISISTTIDSKLTQDDVENDLGVEEGFNPDGIADHRGTFNQTNLNDYSNSEFWSSFSSSEEALLNCDGLVLNLPLTPHHRCTPELNEQEAEEAYFANTITYKVPVNGYYFFVFNSENEVQPNYIRVHFHLNKTVYNVSNPVAACQNTSNQCLLDLKFFSSEKLIMELPVNENDSLWNEEFIVISECEPRTAIYAICVIAVPVMVILFAFS